MWTLNKEGRIPNGTDVALRANLLVISGKRTLFFHNNEEASSNECISHDHIHTMEKTIRSSCQLGFMLYHELCARFVDELLLSDRNAKAIASPHITTGASLGACLGKGNMHFFKYSVLRHVYLLLQIILEEARKSEIMLDDNYHSTRFEEILSRPSFYNQVNCFSKEILAIKIANTAKSCFKKYKYDYRIDSIINLREWRCCKADFDPFLFQEPQLCDF
jgi:hypothetical protein